MEKAKQYIYAGCLNITEKVSFNIASETSYVYILSWQKFIKLTKMVNLASFWILEACDQTEPDRFSKLKLSGDILGNFHTMCDGLQKRLNKTLL